MGRWPSGWDKVCSGYLCTWGWGDIGAAGPPNGDEEKLGEVGRVRRRSCQEPRSAASSTSETVLVDRAEGNDSDSRGRAAEVSCPEPCHGIIRAPVSGFTKRSGDGEEEGSIPEPVSNAVGGESLTVPESSLGKENGEEGTLAEHESPTQQVELQSPIQEQNIDISSQTPVLQNGELRTNNQYPAAEQTPQANSQSPDQEKNPQVNNPVPVPTQAIIQSPTTGENSQFNSQTTNLESIQTSTPEKDQPPDETEGAQPPTPEPKPDDPVTTEEIQSRIWSPDVINTTLTLIPVILSITVVSVLLLFSILHCCSPHEVTHVTNTYTTKLVKRKAPGKTRPAEATEQGAILENGPEDSPHPVTAPREQQADVQESSGGFSPSSDLYIPHYPRHSHKVVSQEVRTDSSKVYKQWHRGLLNLNGLRRSPKFVLEKPNAPKLQTRLTRSSRLDSRHDTKYVLSQASHRLQDLPKNKRRKRPHTDLSTIAGSVGESVAADEQPTIITPLKTGVLGESRCGKATLRDNRAGMRESWLNNLFAQKAPGTENLVVLEQKDGQLRGASVGGAQDPDAIMVTDCPLEPKAEAAAGKRKFMMLSDAAVSKVAMAMGKTKNSSGDAKHKNSKGKSKVTEPDAQNVVLTIHNLDSQVSGLGYEGSLESNLKDGSISSNSAPGGKENIDIVHIPETDGKEDPEESTTTESQNPSEFFTIDEETALREIRRQIVELGLSQRPGDVRARVEALAMASLDGVAESYRTAAARGPELRMYGGEADVFSPLDASELFYEARSRLSNKYRSGILSPSEDSAEFYDTRSRVPGRFPIA